MSQDERFDVLIIGGGPNGISTAAYLSKCGLSVCVLEEKPECGGGAEVTEPIPGVRIIPHAMLMYAGPAPGFDQLELWKYGFRMEPAPSQGQISRNEKDIMGWAKIGGYLGDPPFTRELLRATHWCPPHPPEIELTAENTPYMQVYKQHQPDVWTEELMEMTLFDLLDEYIENEPFKVMMSLAAYWSGAGAHWEGVAVPSLAGIQCLQYSRIASGGTCPRGIMHGYFHAIMRCAIAHGAVIRTCCPVEEIMISNGRAVGVRLRDDAARQAKKIWANKAVISATDVKQTFFNLIGPGQVDPGLLQKVGDISLKGGSLYVSHFFTREPLRYRPEYGEVGRSMGRYDSRDIYYEHVADVDGHKTYPVMPPERSPWFGPIGDGSYDAETDPPCTRTDGYLSGPFEMNVSIPEYHPDGPDALDKIKDKMNAYMVKAFSEVFENLNSDNIIYHWAGTPYEEEHRNTGMIAGTWYGTRHCRDQLWTQRPIPELARYRTPIDGFYLAHQTSGHPGGLCLMAITYNLMHILIEDGIVEPGDWWYSSPWYIPQEGKISAIPRNAMPHR